MPVIVIEKYIYFVQPCYSACVSVGVCIYVCIYVRVQVCRLDSYLEESASTMWMLEMGIR